MTESKNNSHAPRSTTDLVILIAAIGMVLVNVATALHTSERVGDVQHQVSEASEQSDEKLDVIHEQTNSNLTGVNERLEKAYAKIERLEELLSEDQ